MREKEQQKDEIRAQFSSFFLKDTITTPKSKAFIAFHEFEET